MIRITDRWSRVSSLPQPTDHAAAPTYNGKLFVVGGYIIVEGQRTPTNKSFVYNPSVDKWKEIKSMPTSRGALTANFINDILYVIGGQDCLLVRRWVQMKRMIRKQTYGLKNNQCLLKDISTCICSTRRKIICDRG